MIGIAFSFGLLSSLHCLGMCGPLQAVVMGQWLKSNRKSQWILYHLGRITTYVLLGLIAALFGSAIGIPQWQHEFTLAAGILLLFGYFGFKALQWDRKFSALLSPFLIRMQSQVKGKTGAQWFVLSGALNGLLPCGMVYAALLPATLAENPFSGMLYMLVFGLGTLPLLGSFNLFSNSIMARFAPQVNRLIPISVVLIATLLILRGLELDIPYLSPEMPKPNASVEHCG